MPADLADPHGVAAVADALTGATVDVLVNVAGVGGQGQFAIERTLTADLAMIQLNVTALVHLTGLVLPGILTRRRGGILNVDRRLPARAGPGRLQRDQGVREVVQPSPDRGNPRKWCPGHGAVPRPGGKRLRRDRRIPAANEQPADARPNRRRGRRCRLAGPGRRPRPRRPDIPTRIGLQAVRFLPWRLIARSVGRS